MRLFVKQHEQRARTCFIKRTGKERVAAWPIREVSLMQNEARAGEVLPNR
jgi:hypothetical protein